MTLYLLCNNPDCFRRWDFTPPPLPMLAIALARLIEANAMCPYCNAIGAQILPGPTPATPATREPA